ncbi:hypothetical protein GCM10011374_36490 [Kocuria dechangensis]|uniref:Uncharacterized protein n=1 Tax=Kocuria dechangensis TaxID=1176249 RepID=A0A917LZA4_9MICC|nr:hypothetical protein [Kocuria dechangensis]GGG68789.1 hypothetical protein GCM10011374_36490 [Kocuria dechangensis]
MTAPTAAPATTLSTVIGLRCADLHSHRPGGLPSALTELWQVIDAVRDTLAAHYTDLEYRYAELWQDMHNDTSLLGAATSLQQHRAGADPNRPQVRVIPHQDDIYVYADTETYHSALAELGQMVDLSYGTPAYPMSPGMAHASTLLWAQVIPGEDPAAVGIQVHVPATAGLPAVIAAEQEQTSSAPTTPGQRPRYAW